MKTELLAVEAALGIVREHARPLPPRPVGLLDALGRILAQEVAADADSPPFTKAMMDGYAVRAADLPGGSGTLVVIEEVNAGAVPTRRVEAGEATRIMTGAPIPEGADAVVPVEETRLEGDRVHIAARKLVAGTNVLERGREMRAGEVVVPAGRVLRPQDLGVLATVGCGQPLVAVLPVVHILSTGDEVVSWDKVPGPGQIRNSNGAMLHAQVARAGGRPHFGGIVGDDRASLQASIATGLGGDVLILSGGVSAGKRDLVPEVLAEAGVMAHFHKVALKPGKPLLFGTKQRAGQPPVLVFGLPGNPVSSFVCFELFVRPALALLAGRDPASRVRRLPLAEPVLYRTDRPTYHPAALDGGRVRLVPWFGSADLRGLLAADALAVIPAGEHSFAAGDVLEVVALEEPDDGRGSGPGNGRRDPASTGPA